jgi:hypothetical protein
MKKIRCTYRELVKATTPDWGTSPGCQKLREHLREIYADRAIRQHCLNPTKWRINTGDRGNPDTYIIHEPDL